MEGHHHHTTTTTAARHESIQWHAYAKWRWDDKGGAGKLQGQSNQGWLRRHDAILAHTGTIAVSKQQDPGEDA